MVFAFSCVCMQAKLLQSCPTLCNTVDYNLPDSSFHGIFQARILKWVAVLSSRVSSRPRDRALISLCLLHWQVGSLPRVPSGKPLAFSYWKAIAFIVPQLILMKQPQCEENKYKGVLNGYVIMIFSSHKTFHTSWDGHFICIKYFNSHNTLIK